MTGVKVAIFYLVSGNNLSTRAYHSIGDVSVGYHSYIVDLDVEAGDLIGIHFSSGGVSRDNITSWGYYTTIGDYIPCEDYGFSVYADRIISLHGTSEILPPPLAEASRTGIYTFKTTK